MSSAPAETKKKGKLPLIVGLAVLLLGGGGAGGWWFMNQAKAAPVAGAAKPARKPVFAVLEPFTVNLRDSRGERFAQIGVTFEVDDAAIELELKERLPAVRNNILLLISAKEIEELLTTDGKQKLAEEIRKGAGAALSAAENPIRKVLFSHFIVQ